MTEPAAEPLFDPEVPAPPSDCAAGGYAQVRNCWTERRNQGLSLGDIARQLKLSVRQIEALERDDYASFSGPVFVRGFLRNYAKLLHLDPEPLLAAASLSVAPATVHATAEAYVPVSAASPERRRKFMRVGRLRRAGGPGACSCWRPTYPRTGRMPRRPETAQPTPAETPSTLAATPQPPTRHRRCHRKPRHSRLQQSQRLRCSPAPALLLRNRRNRNRLLLLNLRRQRLQRGQLRLPRHLRAPSRQCQTPRQPMRPPLQGLSRRSAAAG